MTGPSAGHVVSILAVALALWASACGPGLDRAVKLFVTSPPESITAGQPLQISAHIRTDQDETVEAYQGRVTAEIFSGPHRDALAGTTTVQAVKGVAVFSDLTLTRTGAGYRLNFRAETVPGGVDLPDQTVGPVAVTAGAASGITLLDQPGRSAPGATVFPFPRVAVSDAFGNVVTDTQTQLTVALENNPGNATLDGTLTRSTSGGIAVFDDLRVSRPGEGYTLRFTSDLGSVISRPFDVVAPTLVYTDPPAGGILRLVRNPASTGTVAVLDLVAAESFTGYSVGFTLPLDPRAVKGGAPLITAGAGLNPGSAPAALGAALPRTGRMAGRLTAGVSQKAAGAGAVTTDTLIPAGTVLFTVRLEAADGPLFKEAFDGARLGLSFEAAARNRAGEDVVDGLAFRFGRLAVE